MPVRLPEVAAVLGLIVLLIAAKWVPLFAGLPLAEITGIVCFSFAIFLALRLFQFELERLNAE